MVDFRRAAHDRKSIIIEYLLSAAESRKEITEAHICVSNILCINSFKKQKLIEFILFLHGFFFFRAAKYTGRSSHHTHTHTLSSFYILEAKKKPIQKSCRCHLISIHWIQPKQQSRHHQDLRLVWGSIESGFMTEHEELPNTETDVHRALVVGFRFRSTGTYVLVPPRIVLRLVLRIKCMQIASNG